MARHFKLRELLVVWFYARNYGNVWDTRDRRDYRGYKWVAQMRAILMMVMVGGDGYS